jgi:hypothetical protein
LPLGGRSQRHNGKGGQNLERRRRRLPEQGLPKIKIKARYFPSGLFDLLPTILAATWLAQNLSFTPILAKIKRKLAITPHFVNSDWSKCEIPESMQGRSLLAAMRQQSAGKKSG